MLSSSTGNEQNVAVKQYLHKLMNAEFVERGDNQRFRAVIFQVIYFAIIIMIGLI